MKIEKVNQKRNEISKIINYFKSKEYGSTVEFMELQPLTHYNLLDELEQYKFKTCIMSNVKTSLIDYGIVLKSVKFIGYYILKPNQIASYTYRTYIIKPSKALNRAERILANTDTKKLTTRELNKHNLMQELNSELYDSTNSILSQLKYSKVDEDNK